MIFTDGNLANGLANEIISYLQDKLSSLDSIPKEKFLINKSLTREPESYADPKNQPHVMVALHMKQQGKPVHAHDTISFLIVTRNGSNSGLLSDRAVSLNEFIKGEEEMMKIDFEWYLSQQIFPPIARLTEFVPNLDHLKLAKALGIIYTLESNLLGLDTRKYVNNNSANNVSSEKTLLMEELTVQCSSCGGESQVTFLSECSHCNATLSLTLVVKKIDDFCNKASLTTAEDKVSSKRNL